MKVNLFLLIAVASFLHCSSPSKKEEKTDLFIELNNLIEAEHKAGRFNGTVLIGTKDSIIYKKAIGKANRVWNVPLKIEHRFDIASVNKSFIAALILIAIEEEKLNLTSTLIDLLSKYSYSGEYSSEITVHQLLSHTSGLADYSAVAKELSSNNFRAFKRQHFNNAEYVDFISQVPLVNEPGKQFYYSNFAYHLLCIILEDVYQKPFKEILREKICIPLKLKHTFSTDDNQTVFPNLTEAYTFQKSDSTWKRNSFIDLTLGRRIFSSSEDLYKWGKAMNEVSWISSETLIKIQTNYIKKITPNVSYGYGWVVYEASETYRVGDLEIDHPYIIHGGETGSYKSMIVNINKGDWIITWLSNTGQHFNEIQFTKKITHILLQSNN